MDLKTFIYIVLLVLQLLMLIRLWIEANWCDWSPQSKWIARRVSMVIFSIACMTAVSGWGMESVDNLMDWILGCGMAALTIATCLHFPDILSGMSDKEVGENLNIRMKKD